MCQLSIMTFFTFFSDPWERTAPEKTWTFFQALTFGADRRESGLPEVRTAPDRVESWLSFWVPQTSWLHHWTRPARAKISRRCWEFFVDGFLFRPKEEVVFFFDYRGKHVENRKHEFESRIMRCLSFGDWILCFDNITFDELILVHHGSAIELARMMKLGCQEQ